MNSLRSANLTLMFVLELAVYAAVCFWGATTSAPVALRILAAIGAPVVLAIGWGIFASPKARVPLRGQVRAAFEIVWFGCGVLALLLAGQPVLAAVLAVLYAVNAVLRLRWHQV